MSTSKKPSASNLKKKFNDFNNVNVLTTTNELLFHIYNQKYFSYIYFYISFFIFFNNTQLQKRLSVSLST
jgi:hypothetical protein